MLGVSMRLPTVLLTLPCLLLPSWAVADSSEPAPSDLRQALQRNELVSFTSILDWIEARYVGKVVEVELEDEYGRLKYEVDLLTPDGDMLEFQFNARDGGLIGINGPNIERARRP